MTLSSEIKLFLQIVEEGYKSKAWHGPNLSGAIRGLTANEAAWRHGKNRHNIWEIVVHCAYWKYIVRRRILGEKRGSFPLKGSNWFKRPDGKPTENEWRRDVKLLDEVHRSMVDAIAELKTSDLKKIPRGTKYNNRFTISGIAMHDVYHAGQVQLIKRMIK